MAEEVLIPTPAVHVPFILLTKSFVTEDFCADAWSVTELKERLLKATELTSNFGAASVRKAIGILEEKHVDGNIFTKMSVGGFRSFGITQKIAVAFTFFGEYLKNVTFRNF